MLLTIENMLASLNTQESHEVWEDGSQHAASSSSDEDTINFLDSIYEKFSLHYQ
jgi:hypothetical protein